MRPTEPESNAENPESTASDSGSLSCFLLTRQWRDASDGLELTFWAASPDGPVRVVVQGERAVCFVERGTHIGGHVANDVQFEHRPLELRTMEGKPVDGLYFQRQRDLLAVRRALKAEQIAVYESDIKPSDRYLMERFITASFSLRGEPTRRNGFFE